MKTKVPLSFRLDDDVREKLREFSEKTGLPERTIAQMAISAAVAAWKSRARRPRSVRADNLRRDVAQK